jgi:hypothetical protein
MTDAENERLRLDSHIGTLERENAEIIQQNRSLLDELEGLNEALSVSNTRVNELTSLLDATQQELNRLGLLAARTESLEKQLADLEKEYIQIEAEYNSKVEDERTAIQRWKQAEKTIAILEDQMDRIEREAKDERERHVEVVGRLERQREVERELNTAAGRLKGAAAMKTMGGAGSNVVSHFVQDILQDNANLQVGIVELREMLANSNEEVERLRERVSLHQPVDGTALKSTLATELPCSPPKNNAELALHVHHHYHSPNQDQKSPGHQRRVKKKRPVITPGHFTPRYHTPRSSISTTQSNLQPSLVSASSAASIISHTRASVPQIDKRWSIASNHTGMSIASSVPTSPYSHSHRASSIFDRALTDVSYGSSTPTSPATTAPGSPLVEPVKDMQDAPAIPADDSTLSAAKPSTVKKAKKPQLTSGLRTFSCPVAFPGKSAPSAASSTLTYIHQTSASISPSSHVSNSIIHEETDVEQSAKQSESNPTSMATLASSSSAGTPVPASSSESETATSDGSCSPYFPLLRRAESHESILSISGMNIHTSQQQYRAFRSPLLSYSPNLSSTNPVISHMHAVADPLSASVRQQQGSGLHNARNILGNVSSMYHWSKNEKPHGRHDKHQRPEEESSDSSVSRTNSRNPLPLPTKLGGWILGRWGATPVPSNKIENVRVSTHSPSLSETSRMPSKDPKDGETSIAKFRSPGVNQQGAIFGLGREKSDKIPVKLQVADDELDREALGEALLEAGAEES